MNHGHLRSVAKRLNDSLSFFIPKMRAQQKHCSSTISSKVNQHLIIKLEKWHSDNCHKTTCPHQPQNTLSPTGYDLHPYVVMLLEQLHYYAQQLFCFYNSFAWADMKQDQVLWCVCFVDDKFWLMKLYLVSKDFPI